jgi:hypothetical protein
MSRPAPIAALDAAIEEHLAALIEAEKKLGRTLADNIRAVSAVDEAVRVRSEAFYAVRQCEDAIRKLGYVVLGQKRDESALDSHPLDFPTEKAHALWREGLPGGRKPE